MQIRSAGDCVLARRNAPNQATNDVQKVDPHPPNDVGICGRMRTSLPFARHPFATAPKYYMTY